MDQTQYEKELIKNIGKFKYDPLGFVMYVFPWGLKGSPLENYPSPDVWQIDYLNDMKDRMLDNPSTSLQYATSSGHGIGKSALTAMIILWFMSTRPNCAGVVTANTASQLQTKTWRELSVWLDRSINKHWFEITRDKIFHIDNKATWSISAITNSEKNSEGFAGLHGLPESVLIIYDEASAIPDKIYEVTEGAMTTPGAHWHTFSNPTRNTGRFKDSFVRFKDRWITKQIDSRDCSLTDKKKLDEWVEDWGEESDFVYVRIRGMFPRASNTEFFPEELIEESARNEVEPIDYMNHPKILGVDVARGGGDSSVIFLRQGPKATILGTYQLQNLMDLAGKVVTLFNSERAAHIYVDSTGLGAGVYDRLKQINMPVTGVSFGTKAIDKRTYLNTRAEIYGRLKTWMEQGGSIPQDPRLKQELKQQQFGYTEQLAIQLESKQRMRSRGLDSPDLTDALACTFFGESLELLRPRVQYKQIQSASAVGWT